MMPFYEEVSCDLKIFERDSSHFPPHIHKSMECLYINEGTLELGIGQDFYHMNTGDFAIIFPDLIHHYQYFGGAHGVSTYLMVSPMLSGGYLPSLQQYCPSNPVISADQVHPDIHYALHSLLTNPVKEQELTVHLAFVQLILARSMPYFHLVQKNTVGSNDIIYQTVAYIAKHFTENISLTSMSHDLGFSPYALSRVFSGTFHTNFNTYVNNMRLDYACSILQNTDQSITEAFGNAGFESQRTFNRVFLERYRMSPREYRNQVNTQNHKMK